MEFCKQGHEYITFNDSTFERYVSKADKKPNFISQVSEIENFITVALYLHLKVFQWIN
jgi:hypothetical protein